MVITHASTPPGPRGEDSGAAEMAARIASGPGFWTGWLAELDRQGLLEELLAEDVIARALREAPPGHKYDRVLTARMTVICVLAACLFPGAGDDTVLATAFGLPGLHLRPGTDVPTGAAFSQARRLLGEQVMKKTFELDAAVADADLGIGLLWKGLEVTAIDGTTMELARNGVLEDGFGTPAEGARPLLRITAHVRTATFRWIGAAIGGYHDGENALADQLEDSFTPGILNLADRGFFSMHRWIRFSGTGADLAWRVKNGAKSVPLKTLETLPDGSELVMLHESDGMRARRRKEAGDHRAARLPDTIARLVTFTVTATTRSGRTKTTQMRVLTTLLDHQAHPAREIAALYAERWQIEIAFLHLKKTVRGPRRPLRGQSPEFARQEAWALLLIHNITATASARAAGFRRHRPRRHPVHRRARPHPLPRRCRDPLPALRAPPRQPAGQPEHRDPRPAPPPSGPPANIRENRSRTTSQAHRRSHLHHRHHKVESSEMGHNSGNLRAVGSGQSITVSSRRPIMPKSLSACWRA